MPFGKFIGIVTGNRAVAVVGHWPHRKLHEVDRGQGRVNRSQRIGMNHVFSIVQDYATETAADALLIHA